MTVGSEHGSIVTVVPGTSIVTVGSEHGSILTAVPSTVDPEGRAGHVDPDRLPSTVVSFRSSLGPSTGPIRRRVDVFDWPPGSVGPRVGERAGRGGGTPGSSVVKVRADLRDSAVAGAAGQAARRVGGPVLWMVPSGKRTVSSRLGPSVMSQPASWILL